MILYEDNYLRGRPQGEIIGLLRAGLAGARRTKEMQAFTAWTAAVDVALRAIRPGELLLLQADVVDQAVNHLKAMLGTSVVVSANGVAATNGVTKTSTILHVAG